MGQRIPDTLNAAAQLTGVARGLAVLAFGSGATVVPGDGGKHLAFLPLEALELDLADPEQRDFGDYELIEQLGQGGMGVVYRARQRSLERDVALKLLSAGPWASPDFIARFRREAQSAARLQHPNIVPIYEIGQHAELNFFSMALIRGESLAQRLDRLGPLPAREAARMLRTIAEALDYAHRLGILHLDLKPANVLVDEHGEPQVADFGLARRLDETFAGDSDEVSGTPSYMAPEQAMAKSQRIGVATDIYGLGAILYELLTGRPPFLGATPRQTLEDVVKREVVAPRSHNPQLPADLDAIVLKCLGKDPTERYASARALAEDLGRFIDGRAVSVRPLRKRERLARWARREPKLALAVVAAVLALLTGLVATSLQWQRAEAHAEAARGNLWSARAQAAQSAMAQGDAFLGLRGLVENLAEMEAAGREDVAAIERQRLGTALANAPMLVDLIRLPTGEAASALAISPDGRRLAVASYGNQVPRRLRQFDVDSGELLWETSTDDLTRGLPVASTFPHGRVAYTPDGSRVLVHLVQNNPFPAPTMSDGILLDSRTGSVVAPATLPEHHADFIYSDDGRLALQRSRTEAAMRFPQNGQLFRVADWSPLGPRLAHHADNGFEWLFTPDGSGLLGSGDFLRLTLFEPATLAPRWSVQMPDDAPVRAWRFSGDGRWLALGTTQGRVWLVDARDGRREELVSSPSATVRWLEFNADGSTLAARAEDGSIAAWDVASRLPRMAAFRDPRLAGVQRLRLVDNTLVASGGSAVHLLDLAPPSRFNREVVPASARLRNRRNVMSSAFDLQPARRLLVIGGTDGLIGIWRLPRPALLPFRAAPLPAQRLDFDGRRLIAVEGQRAQVVDVETGDPRSPTLLHPQPVRLAELAADGRTLVTVAGRSVRLFDPVTGALRGSPLLLPQTPLRAMLAQDGRRLLLTTLEYLDDRLHERVHVLDLETGEASVAAPLPGLIESPEFDRGGRLMLHHPPASTSEQKRIALFELEATSRACAALELEPGQFPGYSAIASDGHSVWSYVSTRERRGQLLRWELDSCRVRQRLPLQQGTGSNFMLARPGGGVAINQLVDGSLSLFADDGERREVPGMDGWQTMKHFALSRDGRRAALAGRNAVQVFDLVRGERLSAALTTPIAGSDAIAALTFAPDGRRLLARTINGRWLAWNLPTATDSAADLAALATVLDPSGADPELTDERFQAVRRLLRSRAPSAVADAPDDALVIAIEPEPGEHVDPRYVPLDLSPVINVPLHEGWPPRAETPGDAPTLALGPQRLNGVDWRVDGGVHLNGGAAASHFGSYLPITAELPLPALPLRRVHALVRTSVPISPQAPPKVAARILLAGADGRQHALDVLTLRHLVPSGWGFESLLGTEARIAWAGIGAGAVRSGHASGSDVYETLFAVAFDVPAGAGPLRGLRLAVGDGPIEAPLFYAVTLEREIEPLQSNLEPTP